MLCCWYCRCYMYDCVAFIIVAAFLIVVTGVVAVALVIAVDAFGNVVAILVVFLVLYTGCTRW